jgi:hypothetical protein
MNRSRFAVVVAVALVASSCIGTMLQNNTEQFKGQNISVAVSKLGFPTDKREMLGKTIYTWKTGNPQALYCNIDLVVDSQDIVTAAQWNGTNGGCLELIQRLR